MVAYKQLNNKSRNLYTVDLVIFARFYFLPHTVNVLLWRACPPVRFHSVHTIFSWSICLAGGGPRVVVSTAAFHARVRGSVPGLGGLKETKLFLPHPRVKASIVGSLRDREVACSVSDRQGSNFESCVWRTVSSHHPQEVLLAQFSLYVHKGGLKPDSFHCLASPANFIYGRVETKVLSHVTFMPVLLRPVNNFMGQVIGNASEATILWTTLQPGKWPFKNAWIRRLP